MLMVAASVAAYHDPALAALAAATCLLACLTYVSMLARAVAARGNFRLAWVAGAAVAFGGGVWATQLVALIGYQTTLQPAFALVPGIVSLGIAIAGSALAALVQVRLPPRAGGWVARRMLAGLLLGGSIVSMHFTGMLALRRVGLMLFDGDLAVASVALGVILSAAAMVA